MLSPTIPMGDRHRRAVTHTRPEGERNKCRAVEEEAAVVAPGVVPQRRNHMARRLAAVAVAVAPEAALQRRNHKALRLVVAARVATSGANGAVRQPMVGDPLEQ